MEVQDDTMEVSDNYKDQLCECVSTMFEFEKTPVGFATEKNKEMHLRRLESMIKSRVMPEVYLEMAYNFLIGALWTRFAPI